MSPDNYHVLKYLCEFLAKIADYKEINKMSAENLSMIFGHNFMRSETNPSPEKILATSAQVQRYIAILVDNCEWFFGKRLDEMQSKPYAMIWD